MANFYPALTGMLIANGCIFVRAGKGSYEVWFSPVSAKNFTVPRSTKSRHTANEILKQAGLQKAF